MIRDPSQCTLANTVLDYDEKIRRHKADDRSVEPVDSELYGKVLLSAEREVLRTCQIVLCTCNGSASRRVKGETNISQVCLCSLNVSITAE